MRADLKTESGDQTWKASDMTRLDVAASHFKLLTTRHKSPATGKIYT